MKMVTASLLGIAFLGGGCGGGAADSPASTGGSHASGASAGAGGTNSVCWRGAFDATSDTKDGVHPNASGDAKIAATWAKALESFF